MIRLSESKPKNGIKLHQQELKSSERNPLMAVAQIDNLLPIAAAISLFSWVFLVATVYALAPTESLVHLDGPERESASAAFFVFLVNAPFMLHPFIVRQSKHKEVSGIVWSAITVQLVALMTNALLAWAPTVVMVDPITHARVYFIRWCEWVPMAGFLTFLSEVIDCQAGAFGVLLPVLVGLTQALSCFCAFIFPLCPNTASWLLFMLLSCLLWAVIFPRLWVKYQTFKKTGPGITLSENERHSRVKFGYHLLLTCTIVWTILVVLYFAAMAVNHLLPEGHSLRHQALPMVLDTFFDVLAKLLYMRVVLEVHKTVFDADGRAKRQLSELRQMISVLWETSSDVIVISVRQGNRLRTMISPKFPAMLRVSPSACPFDVGTVGAAIMVETFESGALSKDEEGDDSEKSQAYVIDLAEIPYALEQEGRVLVPVDGMDEIVVKEAEGIISALWAGISSSDSSSSASDIDELTGKKEKVLLHEARRVDGSSAKCEMNAWRRGDNALIAIVRDATERQERFDAERRASLEAQARHEQAEAVNRFAKHEIRNGLLAGMELCKKIHNVNHSRIMKPEFSEIKIEKMSNCVSELDTRLHEVFDAALAEALARDVLQETYEPKIELVDVFEVLSASNSKLQAERFPIAMYPTDMPFIFIDKQLLRCIHRNAILNACKYGRKGGVVKTEVRYNQSSNDFQIEVINEPGERNSDLVNLGDIATRSVFEKGKRLDIHISDTVEGDVPAGEGAWIMQQCAKALGGQCKIRFDPFQTVFTFRCLAESCTWPKEENMQLDIPPGTWGIAVDDSSIQRRAMQRILRDAGIEDERLVLLGKNPTDVQKLEKLLLKILTQDESSTVLLLMDENLEYTINDVHTRLSGSQYTEMALKKLTPKQEARVFALIRSGSDSADDLAKYKKRTHGFFPKASMHRNRVRELLVPAWQERFIGDTEGALMEAIPDVNDVDPFVFEDPALADPVSTDELLKSLERVDSILSNDSGFDWDELWGGLHALKGDLMVFGESEEVALAVQLINSMWGKGQTCDFRTQWRNLRALIVNKAKNASESNWVITSQPLAKAIPATIAPLTKSSPATLSLNRTCESKKKVSPDSSWSIMSQSQVEDNPLECFMSPRSSKPSYM